MGPVGLPDMSHKCLFQVNRFYFLDDLPFVLLWLVAFGLGVFSLSWVGNRNLENARQFSPFG